MTDPATMLDQTAALITHAAIWSRTTNEPDSRPGIVRAVENWNRVLNPATDDDHLPGPCPSSDDDRRRLHTAARRALRVYPGPAGELIHRELLAAAELGYRFGLGHRTHRDALLLRLAELLLTRPPAA